MAPLVGSWRLAKMLNGYDEWRCDQCNQHCHWSELIFKGNRDICDDCDERNKSGEEE